LKADVVTSLKVSHPLLVSVHAASAEAVLVRCGYSWLISRYHMWQDQLVRCRFK